MTDQEFRDPEPTAAATIYTLCIGLGADAGDWPELGEWNHFTSLSRLMAYAEEQGLDTETPRDIDGMPQDHKDWQDGDCLCHTDDVTTDAVARIHIEPVAAD